MKRTPLGMNDGHRFHSLSGMSLYGDLRSVALWERDHLGRIAKRAGRPRSRGKKLIRMKTALFLAYRRQQSR